jgi:hypothetical protein
MEQNTKIVFVQMVDCYTICQKVAMAQFLIVVFTTVTINMTILQKVCGFLLRHHIESIVRVISMNQAEARLAGKQEDYDVQSYYNGRVSGMQYVLKTLFEEKLYKYGE